MMMEAWWWMVAGLVSISMGVQTEWKPLHSIGGGVGSSLSLSGGGGLRIGPQSRNFLGPDHCNLHKVVMHQDSYYQYVQYKTRIPDLKEFTLCTWHKFYNHSRHHPLFSYALKSQPREIVSWVANTDQSSFYSMAISGHTIYRINYPIRLFRWYHSCQSWNGRTGEWQLWVNSERVGRGFYNIVAGRAIKGGGMAMSGQEQRSYGTGFPEGFMDGGLLGEITLVQMYKAALTAGKAYTDHKHHHAHKFHHEDKLGEDDPEGLQGLGGGQQLGGLQLMPQEMMQQMNGPRDPLLMNMQLVPRLPVEELSVRPQAVLMSQGDGIQGIGSAADVLAPFGSHSLFKREGNSTKKGMIELKRTSRRIAVENLDNQEEDEENEEEKEVEKNKREIEGRDEGNRGKVDKKSKRTLEQASFGLIPGIDLSTLFPGDGFNLGVGAIRAISPKKESERGSGGRRQSEPAEWEVKSIMSLCSGCGEDPFRKANILSWRGTSKKVFGGALYIQAHQECHNF